jgi:hypothetical protein
MLDFPELLAPARSVNGRTSNVCSSTIDLNPATEIDVIAGGVVAASSGGPLDFDIPGKPFIAGSR